MGPGGRESDPRLQLLHRSGQFLQFAPLVEEPIGHAGERPAGDDSLAVDHLAVGPIPPPAPALLSAARQERLHAAPTALEVLLSRGQRRHPAAVAGRPPAPAVEQGPRLAPLAGSARRPLFLRPPPIMERLAG